MAHSAVDGWRSKGLADVIPGAGAGWTRFLLPGRSQAGANPRWLKDPDVSHEEAGGD